jgi:ribonuclease G
MTIKTREQNPNNKNGAEIEAPILIVRKIAEDLDLILKKGHKNVRLNAHPFIAAFLNEGFFSIKNKWIWQYKQWIKVNPRDAYTYLEYHFTDKDGKNIKL